MLNKEENLLCTMEKNNVDIFTVSEAELEEFDEKKPFSLKGFGTFFPMDRKGTSTKRLLCFVRESIEVKQRTDFMCPELSIVWLEVMGANKKKS